MRWLSRVRLLILQFADRTRIIAAVRSSSKLLNAPSQRTVAASATFISLVITYQNWYITFLPFCLTTGLRVTLCFFILSASFFFCLCFFCVHICLSLSSTLLLYHYALFFSLYFFPLPLILNFHFFSVSFLLSHISPRLLFIPHFVPCVLFMPFFFSVFIPYCLSSLSNCTFVPSLFYCSPRAFHCFLLSSTFIFSPFPSIIFLVIFSLDDSQDTQTYTLHTLWCDVYIPVMQILWLEFMTAK
jgi:hypothetical protein